jgi:hypothetical protein
VTGTSACDRYRSGPRGILADTWHALALPISVVLIGVIGVGVGMVPMGPMSGVTKALLLALPVIVTFLVVVLTIGLGYQPVTHFKATVDPGPTPMFDIRSCCNHGRSLKSVRLEVTTPHGVRYAVPWHFDFAGSGQDPQTPAAGTASLLRESRVPAGG